MRRDRQWDLQESREGREVIREWSLFPAWRTTGGFERQKERVHLFWNRARGKENNDRWMCRKKHADREGSCRTRQMAWKVKGAPQGTVSVHRPPPVGSKRNHPSIRKGPQFYSSSARTCLILSKPLKFSELESCEVKMYSYDLSRSLQTEAVRNLGVILAWVWIPALKSLWP